ncbi:MAG: DUF374 domain-containing protein [Verrucomicrobia bacterium]|nr:DUF374 domain-containing protein [Verrucomicrobiota bacterium]
MDRLTKPSRVVVPHGVAWHGRLAAAAIYMLIRLIAGTVRFRVADRSGVTEGSFKGPAIFCVWHNRLALGLILYRQFICRKDAPRSLAAMVSASKDGGLLARILELFDVQPVRGSSSRRGPQALLELTTWAERGYDLAITPDGPRGPCYLVQDGITSLAQLTGLPIVPVTYHLSRKICLKSWDRFQIPLPFAKCDVTLGRPVQVPREASDAERADLRQKLEAQMRELTVD